MAEEIYDDTNQQKTFGATVPGMECIVLAGGFGTRLQDVLGDLPKVLAPVAGKPFLIYVINYLRMQGISRFVFSLGYKADQVEIFLKEQFPTLDYATVTEEEPLGTGGGIRLALQKTRSENVFIVNGDTLFKADLAGLYEAHITQNAECTLALKPLQNFDRYGTVSINERNHVLAFNEKMFCRDGLINGGIYLLNKTRFFDKSFPQKFSFETGYLQKWCTQTTFYGFVQETYFIDIGVAADYQQAQEDFLTPPPDLLKIDKSWTLFIDRDGVINDETVGEYILHWHHFIFSKGVLGSFKKLSDAFGKLFLVTNQRGVGKGLMTKEALDTIHYEMQREIAVVGGHLDKIYYCTDVDNTSFNRKPNPGMALQAKLDFPEVDFSKSIMAGNKPSDMRFGRAAGMYTVFIATTNPDQPFPHPDIDLRFPDLASFAAALG